MPNFFKEPRVNGPSEIKLELGRRMSDSLWRPSSLAWEAFRDLGLDARPAPLRLAVAVVLVTIYVMLRHSILSSCVQSRNGDDRFISLAFSIR